MANAVLNFGRFFLSSIILHDFTQNNGNAMHNFQNA